MKELIKIIVFLIIFFNIARTKIWQVPEHFPNIQDAINCEEVGNGDTISVAPGIYREYITFRGKNIIVSGRGYVQPGWPRDSTQYVITGEGAIPPHPDTMSIVRFVAGEETNAILQGFTIRDGKGIKTPPGIREIPGDPSLLPTWWNGGGIYILLFLFPL
ncbi:MAG: hypothetical protein QXG39_08790 [Candidatus Aenigmatarchaeota archaeon]